MTESNIAPSDRVPPSALYKDPTQPVETRVADLLARMTLEEKLAQLAQVLLCNLPTDADGRLDCSAIGTVAPGLVFDYKASVADNAVRIRAVQEYLRTHTRLGIPALACCEALHGVVSSGATIYPQAIALGATWNPPLVNEMGGQIAAEAVAAGFNQALSPVLDLGRDPRYGRLEETYGECPTLVTRMAVAFITGMQGENAYAGLPPGKVCCMAKHFAGYSIPANGLNISPVLVGEREMRTHHLVAFEAAVKEAQVMAFMPSYNSVDGVPSHANAWLLTDLLRREWGFPNYVYSDWGGIGMNCVHRIAKDQADAARMALEAGVDVEAPRLLCFAEIPKLIDEGTLDRSVLDQAVARVLRTKFAAGLFDQRRPEASVAEVNRVVGCPRHVELSRRLAAESIILLKNDNRLLPLDPAKTKSIAIIGPNAAQVQFGNYSWTKSNEYGVHFLQAMRERFERMGTGSEPPCVNPGEKTSREAPVPILSGTTLKLNYAKGCDLAGLSTDGFAAAVDAARQSDVAVVVIGDTSAIDSGVGWEDPSQPRGTSGEGFDVTNPVPPCVQEDLVKAVAVTGKPTVVVLLTGRPYSIVWMKEHIPAIVQAFYPGQQQGHALVDVLFGQVNPSGRLPVSVARSAGHIPCTYDFKPYGRGYYHRPGSPESPGFDYVFDTPAPLWPFGFGLSYTTFAYSGLTIATPQVPARDGVLNLSFAVQNTGPVAGKVVAQVYWRDLVAQIAPPEKRLLRFAKIELQPGESRTLCYEVPVGEFRSLSRDMQWIVDPGEVEIQVGDNAEDPALLRACFTIT